MLCNIRFSVCNHRNGQVYGSTSKKRCIICADGDLFRILRFRTECGSQFRNNDNEADKEQYKGEKKTVKGHFGPDTAPKAEFIDKCKPFIARPQVPQVLGPDQRTVFAGNIQLVQESCRIAQIEFKDVRF